LCKSRNASIKSQLGKLLKTLEVEIEVLEDKIEKLNDFDNKDTLLSYEEYQDEKAINTKTIKENNEKLEILTTRNLKLIKQYNFLILEENQETEIRNQIKDLTTQIENNNNTLKALIEIEIDINKKHLNISFTEKDLFLINNAIEVFDEFSNLLKSYDDSLVTNFFKLDYSQQEAEYQELKLKILKLEEEKTLLENLINNHDKINIDNNSDCNITKCRKEFEGRISHLFLLLQKEEKILLDKGEILTSFATINKQYKKLLTFPEYSYIKKIFTKDDFSVFVKEKDKNLKFLSEKRISIVQYIADQKVITKNNISIKHGCS
jgi:hypothetical protein